MIKTMIQTILLLALFLVSTAGQAQQRQVIKLNSGWKFHKGEVKKAMDIDFDDTHWQSVAVPHDWAIYGPFDKEVDKQTVRITQNNEEEATEKTGRTGSLPFIGVGWYRHRIEVPAKADGKKMLLTFDGAMSNAQVYVNGQKVGNWAYGYAYFYFDVTKYLKAGEMNTIAVRLENYPFSSRWYPGAGLYRKVQLVIKEEVSFQHWAHFITTPDVSENIARVNISSKVNGSHLRVETLITDANGHKVAQHTESNQFNDEFIQNIAINNPQLWSPEHPYLYTANINLYENNELKDTEHVRFGIRKIEYLPKVGFKLNGKVTKFKGVCLHHDLGAIGTAINKAALRRQLTIMKEMGCNAIRSAHNMPSLEQLELCDEMGFMFIAESFDEWKKPKVENGYHLFYDEWHQQDVENLIRATRNHPCIVMWSSGNEVPDQWGAVGVKRAKALQEIFHKEDPTRPVTVGMDQVKAVMASGFGALMDVPGLNYRVHLYEEAQARFPQGFILGSETASTVSSRGVYKFPVEQAKGRSYPDGQCSSYDLEYCSWSNIPEVDFVMQDDKEWVIGEFVWTGFDYLGEPTPYDEYWPSRSSYFGICDLAGLPKDRYYLYRSRWNSEQSTLHMLPHWNWEGREGETTPVFVYTSYPSAELFVNGVSQGLRTKNDTMLLERYRLMWMDVKYYPGTVEIVAYDASGNVAERKHMQTAGKPHHIVLEADRKMLIADGNDLAYITATIVDKNGVPCPMAAHQLKVNVDGDGKFRAICNGDATSLEPFHEPSMKAFGGKLVITVQSSTNVGTIDIKVTGKGLKSETVLIVTE